MRGFPLVRVRGGPFERGIQYGAGARDRILTSIDGYRRAFEHWAAWSWDRVLQEAGNFKRAIADFRPDLLEEMRGIAEGAGVGSDDILAINVRTEIMFAGKNRSLTSPVPVECSAFAAVSESRQEHNFVGQNWDWLLHCADTVVVLEVDDPGGMRMLTVVEAGLLAKAGFNSAGLGLVTNALISDADVGAPGVPYHMLLRAVLECSSVSEAVELIKGTWRSSSANYLIADARGNAADVEVTPGGRSWTSVLEPEGGVLVHTNHFLEDPAPRMDVTLQLAPDSPERRMRLLGAVESCRRPWKAKSLQGALSLHGDPDGSVCSHPDPGRPFHERTATIASMVMDLDERSLHLAPGLPCGRHPLQSLRLVM